ncbi:MAG: hypothetical protein FJX40_14260 [Alphaproteobacteria bacterium]|nr:hypothetical protein [Alphaproteobacteria bacterium]MBM3642177.1 hypothetical protein [Alphaproteobacteria bacterium]
MTISSLSTFDLSDRLSNLRKLVLLGLIDGGRERELAIHERFAQSKLSGEWFRPTEEILAFIRDHVREPIQRHRSQKQRKESYYNQECQFAKNVVAFLKAKHPRRTAFNVAKETGCGGNQIAKWLEGSSAPGGPALLRLIEVYGPEILLSLTGGECQWVADAANTQKQKMLQEKIAEKAAGLAALKRQIKA